MSHSSTSNPFVNENINQLTGEITPNDDPVIQASISVHKEIYYARTHADLVENLDVSPEAIFLLTYLCKQSENWVVPQSKLKLRMRCGRTKLERLFSELRKAGYVKYEKIRAKDGTITGTRRLFSRTPEYLSEQLTTKTPISGVMDPHRGSSFLGSRQLEPITNIKTTSTNIKTKIYVEPARPSTINNDDILTVFKHWQHKWHHPGARLDDKRKAFITRALKLYNVEQCCKAIDGSTLTPHNQGDNDTGAIYDAVGIIFKSADNIERFIRNAAKPPVMKPKRGNFSKERASVNAKGFKKGKAAHDRLLGLTGGLLDE